MIKVGGQFSGVGAFDFSLDRLGVEYLNVYQAEWDKYARQTYLANHSTPEYYVEDVNDTPTKEITEKHGSLDIGMFSPPCQSFSLAGKRQGKDDLKGRGILFFNSLEFIEVNKPRFFIFENVKGLISDNKKDKSSEIGQTFSEWLNFLGGKSVNGLPIMFPYEGSVPYHIYWKVLNAKNYGVPQNRERVFIVGIRDDHDNVFTWPKEVPLVKRLKDVLEDEVDEKYYLSETMIKGLNTEHLNADRINNALRCGGGSSLTKKHSFDLVKVGYINQDTQASQVYSSDGLAPSLCAGTHGYANGYIDKPIVAHNLTGGKWDKTHEQSRRVYDVDGIAPAMHTCGGGNQEPKIVAHSLFPRSSKTGKGGTGHLSKEDGTSYCVDTGCSQAVEIFEPKIVAMRGRNPENPSDKTTGCPTVQMLEENSQGISNALTTVQKDNLVVEPWIRGGLQENQPTQTNGISPCLTSAMGMGGGQTPIHNYQENRIRKLTPTECFRLMDFPDSLVENARKVGISNSQLYKQAGNSIVVAVLTGIISKLKL